ncbi:glycoside hydrolase [Arcicella rigui]|uniref:Glycoside hydrolase n=1 Tax=Arcicella rigui TaxID=797020 RepID=A0ABU5Q6U3_9BACT|nr:glycoside hydrolase [Arcicella rigui]MEA5138539.1 glycoside hydrolase [Arcicella rigui]
MKLKSYQNLSNLFNFKRLTSLSLMVSILSCSKAQVVPEAVKSNAQQNITIDAAKTFQKIQHFGASDAWSCQFVGNWSDANKNAIADLLFSQENDANGQPKGIGLSLWRFNIGAGSAEKGSESGINDEWRRAESFLNDNGTYQWDKQAGQIWFLNAAKQRKVSQFLAFTNSPPVQFTVNNKAFATKGQSNLSADKYGDFANFLASVIKGVQTKTGILFDYVSPVNEPQWEWSDGGQEGTPFKNEEIAGITRALSAGLLKANLSTKINVAEAGQLDYLYSASNNALKGNQISDFFSPNSANYIANLPNLEMAISGHSYFTSSPFTQAKDKRKTLADKVAEIPSLKYWMSEYCILGDNSGEMDGNKKNLGIDPALYLARVIHNDLVNGNATAWHWWLAISPYDYKDGLIYIDKSKTNGNFSASKMLWSFGNFSRFIRPNAERVSTVLENENPQSNLLLVSSYKDVANKQLVCVIINSDINAVDVNLNVKNLSINSATSYLTSKDADLKPQKSVAINQAITVPARSIITVVGTY